MGQEDLADYWLDYFASIFQKPACKPKVAWLLQGGMGVGKTYVVEVIMLTVGLHASFQTAKPKHDLFDKFSTGFKQKILVLIDEATDAMTSYHEALNNVITAPTMTFEDKNCPSYPLDLHANIVLFGWVPTHLRFPQCPYPAYVGWVRCQPKKNGPHVSRLVAACPQRPANFTFMGCVQGCAAQKSCRA